MSNPEIIVTVSEIGKKHRIQVRHRYEEGETDLLTCEDIDLGSWVPAQPFTSLVVVGDTPKLLKRADLLADILDAEFQYTSSEFLDRSLPLLKNIIRLSLVAAELPQTSVPPNCLRRVTLDNCVGTSSTTLVPQALEIRQPYTSQLPETLLAFCRSLSLYGLFPSTDKGVFQWSFLDRSINDLLKENPDHRNIWLDKICLKIEDLDCILLSGATLVAIYDCILSSSSTMSEDEIAIYPAITNLYLSSPHFFEVSWLVRACPNLQELSVRSRVLDENFFQILANIPTLSRVDMTDSTISRNVMTSLYQVEDVDLTKLRGISRQRAKKLFPNAIIDWNDGG